MGREDELRWPERKGTLTKELGSMDLLGGYSSVQRCSRGLVLFKSKTPMTRLRCMFSSQKRHYLEREIGRIVLSDPIFTNFQ